MMGITVQPQTIQQAVSSALEAVEDGRHSDAALHWSHASRFEPSNVSILVNNLLALFRMRAFAQADEVAATAMQNNPNDYRFAQEWCRIADTTCEWEKAAFRRETMRKNYVMPLEVIADTLGEEIRCRLEMGNFDSARARLIAAWPNILQANNLNADRIVDICVNLGEHGMALALADRLLACPPDLAKVSHEYLHIVRKRAACAQSNQRWLAKIASPVNVVSIGQNCLPFQLAVRWGLKETPTNDTISPFDLGGHIANTAATILENDFIDYLSKDLIEVRSDGRGVPVAFQRKYGFGFFHERGLSWLEDGIDRMQQAYHIRINNFRRLSRHRPCVFFFCLCGGGDPASIVETLRPQLDAGGASILIVNVLQEDRFENVLDNRVVYRHIPYPRDYNWSSTSDLNSERGIAFEQQVVDCIKLAMTCAAGQD